MFNVVECFQAKLVRCQEISSLEHWSNEEEVGFYEQREVAIQTRREKKKT